MTRFRFTAAAAVLTAVVLFTLLVAAARVGAENPAGPPSGDPRAAAKKAAKGTEKPVQSQDGGTDESKVIEKIELRGGKIERDESQPDRPAIGIVFSTTSRFNDKYVHLLKPFA